VAFYDMETDTYEEDSDSDYMWEGMKPFRFINAILGFEVDEGFVSLVSNRYHFKYY